MILEILYTGLIVSLIVVCIPWIYGILLPIIKPSLGKKTSTYLYGFTTGFFLILGILGYYGQAREEAMKYFIGKYQLLLTSLVMSLTILITFIVVIIIKYFYVKKLINDDKNYDTTLIHTHNHDPHIFNLKDTNPSSKAFALFLLLAHRIPGGLIIGFLISKVATEGFNFVSIIFLITFIIHIIPEELILYYRQIEMGVSKWKATFNSFLATLVLVPFIFIGGYASHFLNNQLFNIIISIVVGSLFIFTSIVEFIPEFLHEKMDYKTWYKVIAFFFLGIVVSTTIFSLHIHN